MPDNAYDRYVTWAMEVPEGVAVPSLDQWGMPVWFPDPDTYFPRNVVAMYAIRNTSDGLAMTTTGQLITAPAGYWFTYTSGSGYGMVADAYFTGGTPDTSGGTQYPPEADRDLPVNPPQWVEDGTLPPGQEPVDPSDGEDVAEELEGAQEAAQTPDDTDMTEEQIDEAMENGEPVEIVAPPEQEQA